MTVYANKAKHREGIATLSDSDLRCVLDMVRGAAREGSSVLSAARAACIAGMLRAEMRRRMRRGKR